MVRVQGGDGGYGREDILPIPATEDHIKQDGGQPIVEVQDPPADRETDPKGPPSEDVDSLQLQKDTHLTNGHSRKLFGLSFFATAFMLFLLLLPYL